MMLLFTHDEYRDFLYSSIQRRPTAVFVSTFNVHVGVSSAGQIYDRAPMYHLLSQLQKTVRDVSILIGTSPLYGDSAGKIINTAEHFGKFQWRFREDLHLKCWIFKWPSRIVAITGGRNLGDSQWYDVSVTLNTTDSHRLFDYFNDLWNCSKAVPRTNLRLKHGS